MTLWQEWWAWAAAGMVFGLIEVLAPAYAFLGLAVGAFGVAIVLGGLSILGIAVPGLSLLLLLFAIVSLLAWIVIRIFFAAPGGQVKIWRRDINKN